MASFTRHSIEAFFERYLLSNVEDKKRLDTCIIFGAGKQTNPPITKYFSKIIRVDSNANANADLYCDITHLPLDSNSYDCIVIDQVLEHTEFPIKVLKEAKRLLRKNGIVLIATPYLIQIHKMPIDYWRFSKEALQFLLNELSFSSIETGSWGGKMLTVLHLYTYFHGGLPQSIARWFSRFSGDDQRAPLMVFAGGKK